MSLEPRLHAMRYLSLFPKSEHWKPWHSLTAKKLEALVPPRTSPRVWISLLRQAIITVRDEPTFTLDILPPLLSLLRYNLDRSISPMVRLLLAAYIFHATQIDTTETMVDPSRLEQALDNEDDFPLSRPDDSTYVSPYNSHICIHLITHLSCNPPGTDQLQYALESLDPVIDLMILMPFRSTHQTHSRLLDILPILLPKPTQHTPLVRGAAQAPSLTIPHRIAQIKLCFFLTKLVSHARMADTFMENNSLQALVDAMTWLPYLPAEDTWNQFPVYECVFSSISNYATVTIPQAASHRLEEHLEYFFGHLVGVYNALSTMESGHTVGVCWAFFDRVAASRPFHPAWDSLPAQLHASTSLTEDARQRLPGFLDQLARRPLSS
ncbi:hypothetical protein BDV98DRAFT_628731 [Pterulicium gracile]|uniref:Uncharacterized protein n=1 Tax=Pterulicium gracile TaxID=1884261 RepID=A0A5C3QB81_9AGAR|nr:hypothetical protein BDV98DRAFT_628731 [Pterula gracilis]